MNEKLIDFFNKRIPIKGGLENVLLILELVQYVVVFAEEKKAFLIFIVIKSQIHWKAIYFVFIQQVTIRIQIHYFVFRVAKHDKKSSKIY